jgi:cytochrome c-type biogenesis protein CcmE
MANITWEKSQETAVEKLRRGKKNERWKFIVGGLLILGAIAYLVYSSTVSGARFFITVDEVVTDSAYLGQSVRLTGVVLGDTIQYDPSTSSLSFTIAHIPREYEDLAQVLHDSANNPNLNQLHVVMGNTGMPDLLQHEAQAILTGSLGEDGYFHATELNLKCPTRFEEHTPNMLAEQGS